MNYDKSVEIQNLKENALEVLRSVSQLMPDEAMNALGAAVSHVVIKTWPNSERAELLDAWFSMVSRSSLSIEK